MITLLLIEDDPDIVASLSQYLQDEGFDVRTAAGQTTALDSLQQVVPDLILLDLTLADGHGFSLFRAIREQMNVPVIFLSASSDEFSIITGLDLGADDYITKPFRPRELLSRIRSVLRRSGQTAHVIELDGLSVDTERGTVARDGRDLYLSALEYRLLLLFLNHRGQVLTRDRLLDEIWDAGGEFVSDNTLSVYIRRLRSKIELDPEAPLLIQTVRGIGYRLD